jgi:hypothetical protein
VCRVARSRRRKCAERRGPVAALLREGAVRRLVHDPGRRAWSRPGRRGAPRRSGRGASPRPGPGSGCTYTLTKPWPGSGLSYTMPTWAVPMISPSSSATSLEVGVRVGVRGVVGDGLRGEEHEGEARRRTGRSPRSVGPGGRSRTITVMTSHATAEPAGVPLIFPPVRDNHCVTLKIDIEDDRDRALRAGARPDLRAGAGRGAAGGLPAADRAGAGRVARPRRQHGRQGVPGPGVGRGHRDAGAQRNVRRCRGLGGGAGRPRWPRRPTRIACGGSGLSEAAALAAARDALRAAYGRPADACRLTADGL